MRIILTRIIIAGGRNFDMYSMVCNTLDGLIEELKRKGSEVEIVSGGARGADALGERYAQEHNLDLKLFPADWNQFGKAAGPIRNAEMGEYADYLVAFWDGKSRGTAHMIETMKRKGKHGKVVLF